MGKHMPRFDALAESEAAIGPGGRRRRGGSSRAAAASVFARFLSGANSFHGRVFGTCSGVSHARRAVAIPYWSRSKLRTECASVLTSTPTPACAAARACSSLRSRRSGDALISIIVPVRAAASITRSMSSP